MGQVIWGKIGGLYIIGLCSGFRTRNKSKVLSNIQTDRSGIISVKGICPRKPEIRKD